MRHPEDLVGKAVELQSPKTRLNAPNTNYTLTGLDHALSVRVFDYAPPRTQVGAAPSALARFTGSYIPWNITFLEYLPGEVTTVRLQRPVLTGPMSGCYLFRYTVGGPRVAYVGTHESGPQAPLSVRAKTNWKAYLEHSRATAILGASPIDFFSREEIGLAQVGKMGGVPQVYGLFEPNGSSYAVMLAPLGSDTTSQPNMMRFVSLKRMHLQPWSAIAALRAYK